MMARFAKGLPPMILLAGLTGVVCFTLPRAMNLINPLRNAAHRGGFKSYRLLFSSDTCVKLARSPKVAW
jgi:hypothetical protein